jgi:hypothetical protein
LALPVMQPQFIGCPAVVWPLHRLKEETPTYKCEVSRRRYEGMPQWDSKPDLPAHSKQVRDETYTDVRRLTTAIRSEKCVVRRLRRCANVI